jgi:predicted acyltransferase
MPTQNAPPRQRLLSLDVLRGLTVALMILVNNAGDGSVSYSQLRHSVWNGCTLTDLVFPTFLFMVGASIALAFRARRAGGAPRGALVGKVLRRSTLIFLLGLLLNALPSFSLATLRYFGVLQRIALCYALAAIVYLFGGLSLTVAVTILALAGYAWLLLQFVVPGFGIPGVDVALLDPHGNLAAWLDRTLVPAAHLYHHSFYDPEGLLSTLPELGTTLIGVLAGSWLQSAQTPARKSLLLAVSGALLAAAGLGWSHSLPFNKRLWTSSYVLWAAGIALLILAVLYWLIDGPRKLRRGLSPWLAFGTNALSAYLFSEVLAVALAVIPVAGAGNLQRLLFGLLPHWLGPPPFVSMLYSVLFVGICFLPAWLLYRRHIVIKL